MSQTRLFSYSDLLCESLEWIPKNGAIVTWINSILHSVCEIFKRKSSAKTKKKEILFIYCLESARESRVPRSERENKTKFTSLKMWIICIINMSYGNPVDENWKISTFRRKIRTKFTSHLMCMKVELRELKKKKMFIFSGGKNLISKME